MTEILSELGELEDSPAEADPPRAPDPDAETDGMDEVDDLPF